MFILWYHGTIIMNTQIVIEKKLIDWALAFNSIEDQQANQILKGLIESLKEKMNMMTLEIKA